VVSHRHTAGTAVSPRTELKTQRRLDEAADREALRYDLDGLTYGAEPLLILGVM